MAVELHGTICLSAPPAPCDGKQREVSWRNGFGIPLYLTGGHIWQGVGRGCKADVGCQLYIRKAPTEPVEQLLRVVMWDHYRDPSGSPDNEADLTFGGQYFVLEPGGTLRLCYGATLVGEQDGPNIDAGPPHGVISPWNFFANLMGQHQQAYLYFSLTRPE